jgi:hypothetical protein
MTKDNLYIAVACQRQLLLVDVHGERVQHVLEFNNVPLSLLALSRSHEHVFAATPTGMLCCYKFSTGVTVMDTNVHKDEKPAVSRQGDEGVCGW